MVSADGLIFLIFFLIEEDSLSHPSNAAIPIYSSVDGMVNFERTEQSLKAPMPILEIPESKVTFLPTFVRTY